VEESRQRKGDPGKRGADVRKARAVTIDPSGGVLVYDDKLQRILRFK
jgi:hypothetical protein